MPSRCAGSRTSTGSTPIAPSIAACSAKSPWSARTPIFTAGASRGGPGSPAADRQALLLRDRFHRQAAHRRAEALADVGQDLRVVEVGRRLDDGVRHARGILA